MEVKKQIKFQYFSVFFNGNDNKRMRYDLRNWIQLMSQLDLEKRKSEIKGYPVRLEMASFIEKNNDFIHMQFVKMSNSFIPSKAYDNQKIEPIDLEDNEYIALDVNTVYDVQSQTLMIQNNKGSLSPERIKDYINDTAWKHQLFDSGQYISLIPIYNNYDINSISRKKYRQFEISFDCTQNYIEDNSTIGKFMKSMNGIGAKVAYIRVGVGRSSKNSSLNKDEVNDWIELAKKNDGTKSANITYIDDNDDSYKYDLLEKNIITDKYIFSVEPRKCLESAIVKNVMMYLFEKRLHIIRG